MLSSTQIFVEFLPRVREGNDLYSNPDRLSQCFRSELYKIPSSKKYAFWRLSWTYWERNVKSTFITFKQQFCCLYYHLKSCNRTYFNVFWLFTTNGRRISAKNKLFTKMSVDKIIAHKYGGTCSINRGQFPVCK